MLASQSRMRVDAYLSAIRDNASEDPKKLHERSTLIARSLKIKVDEQCFDKPSEQQAPCLMQSSDQMVLDDGHGQSMLARLTSGPEVDLLGAVAGTTAGGGGTFSPYVGVIVDVAKEMENLRTAQYQYIPALALPQKEQLNLKLNNPPSFHKPQSVLVVALPPVKKVPPPTPAPVDPKQVYCVQNPSLALAVDKAPLIFATELAHDLEAPRREQIRLQGRCPGEGRSVTRRLRNRWEHSEVGGARYGGKRQLCTGAGDLRALKVRHST